MNEDEKNSQSISPEESEFDASSFKGNNPKNWNLIIELLDSKLQFGLLDKMRKIKAYHFENNCLTIQPASAEDVAYLLKSAVSQQLKIFIHDALKNEDLKIDITDEGS